MSTTSVVQFDERTISVENASYRWAYAIVTYALLLDVAFRGYFRNEAAWDLMAFVVGGGIFCLLYQMRLQTLAHGWVKKAIIVSVATAIVSAIIAAIVVWTRG